MVAGFRARKRGKMYICNLLLHFYKFWSKKPKKGDTNFLGFSPRLCKQETQEYTQQTNQRYFTTKPFNMLFCLHFEH